LTHAINFRLEHLKYLFVKNGNSVVTIMQNTELATAPSQSRVLQTYTLIWRFFMKRIAPFIAMLVMLFVLFTASARVVFSDQAVSIPNGDLTLSGTLSLPSGQGPFSAVILLSGSGPQDRDEAISVIPGFLPFKWIAEYLANQGVAVLRYDDRGTAKSTGKFETGTSADFANDAEAAFKYLNDRPEIDRKKIGFLGHSEGGMLAAMVAARNSNVAFVISMAGPGVRGYELLIKQEERILRSMGITGKPLDDAQQSSKKSLDLILAKDWAGLEALIYPMALEELKSVPENQKKPAAEIELQARTLTKQTVEAIKGWLGFFIGYDIAADWAKVHVPVLGLFGGLDTQVDASQNRRGLRAALALAGNKDVTTRVFPSANHLFQVAKTGSPSEYATLPMGFVPRFLETIRDWLRSHVGMIR
jgi:uncharacterized protein